jgi:hypothetical protein
MRLADGFEHETKRVGLIGGFERDDIIVLGTLENLGEGCELGVSEVEEYMGLTSPGTYVDTQRHVSVASVRLELLRKQF